ncbi:MAG: hypothetical protein EXQ86_02415 [Rhodospirillales bacterium]|nr:hypothetical protein [Rhodospirillales bacterium]
MAVNSYIIYNSYSVQIGQHT